MADERGRMAMDELLVLFKDRQDARAPCPHPVFSSGIATLVLLQDRGEGTADSCFANYTACPVLLAPRHSNVEIAQILRLHVQTVKSHVTRLFNRTGCGNRLSLTLHLLEVARSGPVENPPLHGVPAQLDPPR